MADAPVSAPKLHQVSPDELTIRRRRKAHGFVYVDGRGKPIVNGDTLERIRSLAVPPAYEDVRISSDRRAHLQAVGRDAAGRIQYRYHPDWSAVRETQKGARLATLCRALPKVRHAVVRDLNRSGVGRSRVLAAVVTLIDRTHIRVGCEDYVHSGRSRGAATLLKRNVHQVGERFKLTFRGKGGQLVETEVKAAGLKRIYPLLLRLPGPRLFQYRDDGGAVRKVTAAQVNAYLAELSGVPVTAKDFRTLAATALAAEQLAGIAPAPSKSARRSQIASVMNEIAERLCNTPAVVRKSYVHARLIKAFDRGKLEVLPRNAVERKYLTRAESIVAALFPP